MPSCIYCSVETVEEEEFCSDECSINFLLIQEGVVSLEEELSEYPLVIGFRGGHAFILQNSGNDLPGESIHFKYAIAMIEKEAEKKYD